MITIGKVAQAMQGFFESIAKARVNSTLLGMGRKKVEEMGYSYEALQAGPGAWPWRKTTHDSAITSDIKVQVQETSEVSEIAHKQSAPSHEIDQDAA